MRVTPIPCSWAKQEMTKDEWIDQALEALGGEDTEFYMVVKNGGVCVQCRYQGCEWGEYVGEMELWEFVVDARGHWEEKHKQ